MGSCTANIDIVVSEPDSLYSSLKITNVCFDGGKGKVVLNPVGGTAPYSYSIDDGITYNDFNIFSGLDLGSYTFVTKDGNNCKSTSELVTIEQFETPSPTVTINGKVDLCEGETVTLQTQQYDTYTWSTTGAKLVSTGQSVIAHEDGYYFVEVSQNNCWANSDTVKVTEIQTYQNQPICLVSVDDATGHNKIEWAKIDDKYISLYNIYRETIFTLRIYRF